MKKVLMLIFIMLLFTACGTKKPKLTEIDATKDTLPDTAKDINKDTTVDKDIKNATSTAEVDESSLKEEQIVIAAPTQEDVDALPEKVSVTLKTSKGDIVIDLLPAKAPFTVANFLNLSKAGFYNGVTFHRVIPDFMVQSGDPFSKDAIRTNDGKGGPGYSFADEVTAEDNMVRGTLAMANSGPNTNGSQFFIVIAESTPWLNGKHTIFGTVKEGMEIVDEISGAERDAQDNPLQAIAIEEVIIN